MWLAKHLITIALLVRNCSASRVESDDDFYRSVSSKRRVVHGEEGIKSILNAIELRSQASSLVNASQLYEDISWLVPCPVAGSIVKYVLQDKLLKDKEHPGFVSARSLQKALMAGTGMSSKFSIFSAGGIAAYSKTDVHQKQRSLARRVASLVLLKSSNALMRVFGSQSGLNLLTMNNADKCANPPESFKERNVGTHTLMLPCNANVRHQQHGLSTDIRAIEHDADGSSEDVRTSRIQRFERWFPKDNMILTEVPGRAGSWELTLQGLAAFMKKLQKEGLQESEFSEAAACAECYSRVPEEDKPAPQGLGAAANPRLALVQWQAWLVWPGLFTYYAEPWPQEGAKWGDGRSISQEDLRNIFVDSTVRGGFMDQVKSGKVHWGILENIHVMHELGNFMGEDRPDFVKLLDYHLYPQIKAGVTEDQAFDGWMTFTRKVLHVMSGTCDDAASVGACE